MVIKTIALVFSIGLTLSCSPKVLVNNSKSSADVGSIDSSEPFAFIFDNFVDIDSSHFVGSVEVLDNGFSINCDLPVVKLIAKEKAIEIGGNLIHIYEHKTPDMKSTCHRIKGKIYRVSNPRDYETQITWRKDRKLEVEDFKGSIINRPYLAATYSGFTYYIIPKLFSRKYIIKSEAYFDCTLSYFKPSENSQYTLDHEQVHFDMSELYRRKLIKEYVELQLRPKDIGAYYQQIFDKYWKELNLKQDEYDAEVYSDRSKQDKWSEWVQWELEHYSKYSDNEIEIIGK